jgi:hypothetical protein
MPASIAGVDRTTYCADYAVLLKTLCLETERMIRLLITLALTSAFMTVAAFGADRESRSYLCIGEQATGFAFQNSTHRWHPGHIISVS